MAGVGGWPSLAVFRWRARRPAPPGYFHIKVQSNDNFVGADLRVRPEGAHAGAPLQYWSFLTATQYQRGVYLPPNP